MLHQLCERSRSCSDSPEGQIDRKLTIVLTALGFPCAGVMEHNHFGTNSAIRNQVNRTDPHKGEWNNTIDIVHSSAAPA
jgi:hypothetical protein